MCKVVQIDVHFQQQLRAVPWICALDLCCTTTPRLLELELPSVVRYSTQNEKLYKLRSEGKSWT